MKKNHILFAGLIFLIALLLCTAAAAAPLSREQVEARLAAGGTITEEERMEILNANLGDDIPTDVGLGRDVTVSADGGKYRILLSALPFTVEFPNSKQTVELKLKDTWMEVAEDAVLIQEKSSGWFTGGTSLSLSSGCTVYGSTPLKEGVPVLILGTDGFLHAYYAGNGTNNSTLTLGEKINYLRGIRAGHLETDIGPSYPILPWGTSWINGSISTGWEGTFSIHYDVDFDIHIWGTELFIRDNSFEVALKDVTLELTDDSVLDGVTIPIVTFSEEVVYVLSVSGGVNVYVSGGGKGKTVFDTNIREGYGCTVTLYGDVAPVFDDWSWNHDANFDITSSNQRGEVYVAYGYGADVKFIEILGIGASYKTGVVVGGETSKNHEYPGDTERKYWHECEDDECVNGSAFWRLGPLSLECIIGPYSAPIAEIAKKDFDPFKEYYASDTFHDQSMTSPCPHKGYRLNVEVVTDTGKKIPGASVSYAPYPEHYDGATNKDTDSEGKAVLYAPKSQIDVTAKAYNSSDPSIIVTQTQSIEKTEDVQDLQIVLEIPVKHLRFVNSAAGEATGWPNDIDFKPFFSENVQIPDDVPALSGRVFTGWNTKEDGSGTTYMPGTKLTLSEDLTLWAQWQIAGDDWYVIYNANGGTKAPGPQIVPKGQDTVLTSELPDGGKLIFKGWTPDTQTMDPVYQPGDTLKYDSEKSVVVLYALWDLSPVPEPIHISFDANGVQDAVLPADVWCETGTWLQPEPAYAPPGSAFTFLGWSEDPDAEEPEYEAGQAYYFFRDTPLFAIWTEKDTITLTFKDVPPGDAAGIPDPISIVPSMSRNVRIPEQIPQKEGLTLLHWNTDVYGRQGQSYDPGSVITLTRDTTLYTQWYAHVTFDANGVENATLPEDAWVLMLTMLKFEPAYAPYGSTLVFRGWSEDPNAKDPEHLPGYMAFFNHHTRLYAIWGEQETVTLTFRDSLSDAVADIPDPITINPSMSPYVHIPDRIPQKSGRAFTGWNTAKDGSGKQLAPGTVLTITKDTTLWAQWKVAENSWYVIYNANGGTKAPGPQIVPKGQDAVLTTELPEGGKLIFRGWSPDPQAMDPVYRPGDTLKYDSEKSVVVLYALWNLSPVPEPIHISFSANGLQGAVVPADVWFEQGTWLQLEPAFAPVGSPFSFLGWSENPLASSPEFPAGRSYYFYKDTELYAIWEKQDTLTLTFRDSLSDAATGIPDPITIIPSMSRDVKIPDRIPEKSGRAFTGWNTAKDGSGKNYAPGSVLTLTKDTTLWAQWKVAENSWFVIYNANGGTKAPGPQIVPKGQDAVLTAEVPEGGNLVFRGWTQDPQSPDPVCQPGDTLKYDSRKNYVVLYALWNLSPEDRPAVITFDANGGLQDTVPRSVSAPKMVYFRLPDEKPFWDQQHEFLGWSRNPEAAGAEMTPGSVAVFGEDTKLYAVWNAHYKVIEGSGSVWDKGSGKTQRFVADGNITYFTELRIDGKRFEDGVEITSGSTVAEISSRAMEKLSVGTHKITFVYEDGEASAPFIVRKTLPPTGDRSHPALWLFLILFGLAGITLVGVLAHSAKKKR